VSTRCPHCGNEIDGDSTVCPQCGKLIGVFKGLSLYRQGHVGFAFLGLLFPFVGLLIYLAFRKKHPESVAMLFIGAVISSLLAIVLALSFVTALLFTT